MIKKAHITNLTISELQNIIKQERHYESSH